MAEAVSSVLGFEQITGLTVVKPLASIPLEADGVTKKRCIATIQCDPFISGAAGAGVRYMDSGADPTVDVGFYLAPGASIKTATSLQSLKFIGVAAPARLTVRYEAFPGPFYA